MGVKLLADTVLGVKLLGGSSVPASIWEKRERGTTVWVQKLQDGQVAIWTARAAGDGDEWAKRGRPAETTIGAGRSGPFIFGAFEPFFWTPRNVNYGEIVGGLDEWTKRAADGSGAWTKRAGAGIAGWTVRIVAGDAAWSSRTPSYEEATAARAVWGADWAMFDGPIFWNPRMAVTGESGPPPWTARESISNDAWGKRAKASAVWRKR